MDGPAFMDTPDAIGAELQRWAERETASVRAQRPRRVLIERQMHSLSDRVPNLRLYHFAERQVMLQPRPAGSWSSAFLEQRALFVSDLLSDGRGIVANGSLHDTLRVPWGHDGQVQRAAVRIPEESAGTNPVDAGYRFPCR